MCANARADIESDILHELGQQQLHLRLAGLTFAVLHGTAVILMLGHQPERRPGQDTGLSALTKRHADALLEILVDQWQTPEALGRPGPEPLLRVHIHAQDQPGSLLDVLTSLHATLREALPNLPADDTGVWHVLTHGTAIDATRLTVRLAVPSREVADWDRNKFAEIERTTRERAARAAALRRSASPVDDKLGAPEDTVISINLITAPAEAP